MISYWNGLFLLVPVWMLRVEARCKSPFRHTPAVCWGGFCPLLAFLPSPAHVWSGAGQCWACSSSRAHFSGKVSSEMQCEECRSGHVEVHVGSRAGKHPAGPCARAPRHPHSVGLGWETSGTDHPAGPFNSDPGRLPSLPAVCLSLAFLTSKDGLLSFGGTGKFFNNSEPASVPGDAPGSLFQL